MQYINAVIIDDEVGNIATLKEFIKKYCFNISVVGSAENIDDGYILIKKTNPDLVFLDIEMPRGNGFELVDKFKKISFEIIFVTAFNNYAIKAFQYAALSYLLKPINIVDLQNAIERITERIKNKNSDIQIKFLLENLKQNDQSFRKIGLPTLNGLYFEEVNSITHIKAEGSYTIAFTLNAKSQLISKSLKEFEDILPTSLFFRIHHSYIVNMNFIKRYYKGRGGYIELNDGTEIEVAVRKKEDFLKKFK